MPQCQDCGATLPTHRPGCHDGAKTGLVYRLRQPVMLHANAEHTNAQRREAADEIERLRAAIRWVLGQAPDHNGHSFGDQAWEKAKPKPRYWWRTHLRALAGMGNLAYDKERRTIVSRGDQQSTAESK